MTIGQRLEQNDVKFGREQKQQSQSRAERIAELRGIIADSQNEIERLEAEQAVEDNPNVAVTGDPKVGLIRDNTGVDGEAPEGAPEGAQDYSDEKYWTKAKLAEEIKNRNVDRKAADLPELPTTGTRAELVERLQQDDRELEQEF